MIVIVDIDKNGYSADENVYVLGNKIIKIENLTPIEENVSEVKFKKIEEELYDVFSKYNINELDKDKPI